MLPHFELTNDDRIKVNPLAYWTGADVAAYREKHNLPVHPALREGLSLDRLRPLHQHSCRRRGRPLGPLARPQQNRMRYPL